jgi:hypothetical protein
MSRRRSDKSPLEGKTWFVGGGPRPNPSPEEPLWFGGVTDGQSLVLMATEAPDKATGRSQLMHLNERMLLENPAGANGLVVLGNKVCFTNDDGSETLLKLPAHCCIVHDETGKRYDRCHVFFVAPAGRKRKAIDEADERAVKRAEAYYGKGVELGVQDYDIPASEGWRKVGDFPRIEYYRYSEVVETGDYHHKWKSPMPVYQSKNGKAWKMPLPAGCQLSWRGFVWP